jgi:hypothetical protein
MVKLTINETLSKQLHSLEEEAVLCDDSGRTVGYYLPESLRKRLICDWAMSQVSEEELERARREPGGSSLEEIWERLRRS